MLPDVISVVVSSLSASASFDIMKKILGEYLATKNVRVESVDKEELAVEIQEKATLIRGGESPEEASRSTREALEKQVRVLDQERHRLVPIAAREHWVALLFAIAAGIVFIISIFLAIVGTVAQAAVTLVSSVAPGFLSSVFFGREAKIEERIKEISADVRESEKARERLALLEQALDVVPAGSRAALIEEYTKKMFRA